MVDGGEGLAIWANGNANVDPLYAKVPASAVLRAAYGTANQIPDFVLVSESLFQLPILIA